MTERTWTGVELVALKGLIQGYDGTPICPCCGSGYPVCASLPYREFAMDVLKHRTDYPDCVVGCGCPRYEWDIDLCAECEAKEDAVMDAVFGEAW